MSGRHNYQPFVKSLYANSHSKLPLDLWVHTIGVTMPMVKPHELYEPVVLRVKTTGRIASPDGTVKHTINPEEPNWYKELCTDLAKVSFTGTDAKHISLRTMENVDIASFTHSQLLVAGEIDVYDTRTGKQLLAATRKEPSSHLHGNKLDKLYHWTEDLHQEMAALMATELTGSVNVDELELRTQPNSSLHKKLVTLVNKSMPSTSYGYDSVARAVPPGVIAERIATAALDQLCAGIEASGSKIIGHFAATAAKVASNAAPGTRKPLLQQYRIAASASTSSFTSDTQMYTNIAQKALAQGPHARSIVYMMYKPIECHHRNKGECKKKDKKNKKPEAVKSEAQQFQLYSGRPVYMSPGAVPSSYRVQSELKPSVLPPLEPVASRLPPLEPVASRLPPLEPVASRLPPLEPVASRLPPLEPIASRLPPLEPIGHSTSSISGRRPMPALVSSNAHVPVVATRSNRPMSLMDILNAAYK
jgi:protein involved in ribonucleotide reduction